jgi:hypothetical protein
MMSIDRFNAANLTAFLMKVARVQCALHSEVRFIFGRVGTAPVGLSGVGVQHCLDLPF